MKFLTDQFLVLEMESLIGEWMRIAKWETARCWTDKELLIYRNHFQIRKTTKENLFRIYVTGTIPLFSFDFTLQYTLSFIFCFIQCTNINSTHSFYFYIYVTCICQMFLSKSHTCPILSTGFQWTKPGVQWSLVEEWNRKYSRVHSSYRKSSHKMKLEV